MGNCCSSNASDTDQAPPHSSAAQEQQSTEPKSNSNNMAARGWHPTPAEQANLFVEAREGMLYFKGWPDSPVLRFAGFNSPELTDGHLTHPFEVEDTMRTIAGLGQGLPLRVTRTYTLRLRSQHHGRGHVMDWDGSHNQWTLDEHCFKELDFVLAKAAENDVRLIIPIINQDNSAACNWCGDFSDLCRMRYGLPDYEAGRKVSFFKDRTMIDSFKVLITQLLNRVNTVNGRRYGDDPAVLAWQTGNEMRLGSDRPAPGAWTDEICGHIKSLAPNTLAADGSHAKAGSTSASFDKDALKSPHVDILSFHYYGDGDAERVRKDVQHVRKAGKVYIATEYGFLSRTDSFSKFMDECRIGGAAGSLVWSLRPHSGKGGFKTHVEDEVNRSFHCPGWPLPLPEDFDKREMPVVQAIRNENYALNGKAPPPHPVPCAPNLWAETRNGYNGLVFQGAAWAASYELECGGNIVQQGISDAVPSGQLHVPIYGPGRYRIRGLSVEGQPGAWSNEVDA